MTCVEVASVEALVSLLVWSGLKVFNWQGDMKMFMVFWTVQMVLIFFYAAATTPVDHFWTLREPNDFHLCNNGSSVC